MRKSGCTPSETIDATADRGFVEPFAIHLLGLDLLGGRIHELVVLPERWLLACKLDPLLHEQLADFSAYSHKDSHKDAEGHIARLRRDVER
jgi:hypothetical protein